MLLLGSVLALAGCASTAWNPGGFTPATAFAPVRPETADAYAARHPDAEAVFLRVEDTREHVFQPADDRWDYIHDRLHQYVVLDPEVEGLTTLSFDVEDGGRLDAVFSRVTAPDGTVRTFGAEDFVRERDGDRWVYRIAYPAVERGSLIEERYRRRYAASSSYAPPLYESVPLQIGYPVDSLRVRFVYPAGWGLQVKAIGAGVFPPYDVDRSDARGRLMVGVDLANVPPAPDEPYAPHFKERGRYLELQVTGVSYGTQAAYTAPESWDALAQDFARYAFRRGSVFGDPATRQARRIVEEAAPDSTKLAAIVEWVQENIEIGDVSGASFDAVLDARRGSPLLITGLTQAMLDRSGLDAEFLLIHPATEGFFDRQFVTGEQFPVPAVGVRLGGELRVVFPYLRGLPVDYFPEAFAGGTAMRISPDGFQGFVDLPRPRRAVSDVEEAYDIELSPDGVLLVEEVKTLSGGAAWLLRQGLRDQDAEEREELFREMLTYSEGEVRDFTAEVEGEGDASAPLVVRLRYGIDHLVTVTPEEVIFQTGGLLSPASMSAFEVDARERRSPIRIYHDEARRKRITLRYPSAWRLTTVPEDVTDRNRFGEVRGTYRAGAGELVVDQEVLLRRTTAEAASYGTLLRLIGSESQLYVPTLVFEVGAGSGG